MTPSPIPARCGGPVRIALACAALALACAGCGRGGGTAVVVSYNCPANANEVAALRADIPAFERRTGIRIALNPFSGEEKLYAMMAAGQEPDIFYTNAAVRDRLAAEGRLLDLRPYAARDSFATRLRPEIVARGASIDGGWYSIANWVFTAGVYYNRALFDAAGIPYPDSAWTWDDMARIARALTVDADGDGTPERYGIYIGSHFIEAFEEMNHAPIRPGALFAEIPEESRDVYRRYLALIASHAMPDVRRVQALGMQAAQMLASGRVAMLVEAVPNPALFETLTIPWGVAPLPRFAGKSPRYFRSESGGLSISARTTHPREAWRALEWILAGAPYYQPNPVLRDAGVVAGWERRYPRLTGSGFADVWRLSEREGGGDLRFFVRFSSWTMQPIMEQLQPLLDRLWTGGLSVDSLVAALPAVNARTARALDRELTRGAMTPAFRNALRARLARERVPGS